MTTEERVVEELNRAQLSEKDAKLTSLRQVQELILNREPTLLPKFVEEVLSYQHDRSADVRKFVAIFIEDVGKKNSELVFKLVPALSYMLQDESPAVVKRVVQTSTLVYKVALKLLSIQGGASAVLFDLWKGLSEIKKRVMNLISSSNDGIRTMVVKFMEMIIIVFSRKSELSDLPKNPEFGLSLDMITPDHEVLPVPDLRAECGMTLQSLLSFAATPLISSINLMTCIGCLSNIARQRPAFMSTVLQAFKSRCENFPASFTKSHINSVCKSMKMQLQFLSRHPSSGEFSGLIADMFSDLGSILPEMEKGKMGSLKRPRLDGSAPSGKKAKEEVEEDDDDAGDLLPCRTADELAEKLNPQITAELVFKSMLNLPDECPQSFLHTFGPVSDAGTKTQVQYVAQLLLSQLVDAGLATYPEKAKKVKAVGLGTEPVTTTQVEEKEATSFKPKLRKVKQFVLSEVTLRDLDKSALDELSRTAMKRLLKEDDKRPVGSDRTKLIVGLGTRFCSPFKEILRTFILEDLKSRYDVAMTWLFEEYALLEGYFAKIPTAEGAEGYDEIMVSLLLAMKEQLDPKDRLFTRLLLEAPRIPTGALDVIRSYCNDEDRVLLGVATLRDLILRRPAVQHQFLSILLDLTTDKREHIRIQAIHVAKKLHSKESLTMEIEAFASSQLARLVNECPAEGGTDSTSWNEESIRVALSLFVGLLALNPQLIFELTQTYVGVSAPVKRVILRVLDHAIRAMGMHSPHVLQLIENCPNGAETLLIRILHILVEKAAPSAEIIRRVRDLYKKRIQDVRFLVPIVTSLEKREIVATLPEFIRQSQGLVKETLSRLLGTHQGSGLPKSPINPKELMISLHNIDTTDESAMKAVMKAVTLLFQERTIYNQEVLSVVLQQLMDQSPLPTLFMRTVIQARQACPRLIPFIMNILSKLISKQIWKQPKVWQGFVKCCQMTKPQSFQIMFQLPPKQLESVFEISPDLKEQVKAHVGSFTPHQRGLIPRAILQVIEKQAPKRKRGKQTKKANVAKEELEVDTEGGKPEDEDEDALLTMDDKKPDIDADAADLALAPVEPSSENPDAIEPMET